MRDFDVVDADGYRLSFGMSTDAAALTTGRARRDQKSDPCLQNQVEGCFGGAAEAR